MNFQHWRTIVWLRWRLGCNQINRLGWVSRSLVYLLMALCVIVGISSLFLSLALGIWLLPPKWPDWMVFVWDGMVFSFLMFWLIGVLTDLQRSEPLSLDKFLHLPVSPQGIFCLNYASSLISLSLIVFFPMMLGWSIVLVWKYGGLLWLGPLLTLAFFMMVTALTYQFRGWLASLMQNKRRRRTILTGITVSVILLSQIPNILDRTVFGARENESKQARLAEENERNKLHEKLRAGEIRSEEHDRLIQEMDHRKHERRTKQFAEMMGWAKIAHVYVPPLWLVAGIDGAARNNWIIVGLSFSGMFGFGCIGLFRSYQTTLRVYRGGFESGRSARARQQSLPASTSDEVPSPNTGANAWMPNWVEGFVPGANEHPTKLYLPPKLEPTL